MIEAALHCAPLTTSVGRPVHCVDLSTAPTLGRLHGPDGPIPLVDGAAAVAFDQPGAFPVTLSVSEGGRADRATATLTVLPRRPIDPPLTLRLEVPAGSAPQTAFDIAEVADPDGPTVQDFERRWTAEPGRIIERIRLSDMAMQGMARLNFRVVDDGGAAVLRFSLRTGETLGRLKARVALDYAPATEANPFGAAVKIDADGVWRLPAAPGADVDAITLLDPDGAAVTRVPIGGGAHVRAGRYAVSVDRADGALRLHIRAVE